MANRLDLHDKLCEIINISEPNGDRHVYFQPPPNIQMKYPAIRYTLDKIVINRADNRNYKNKRGYLLTLIDVNPDSSYVNKLLDIPCCTFVNSYNADNLNHFTFTIYF